MRADAMSLTEPPFAGAESRVLVLLAHPALHKSRVNRRLADALRGLDGVTLHDLYDAYPDFDIDVRREQALLLAHPIVVWQHPLYWYSTPAMLKEWQDLVLEFDWAYGPRGRALEGKLLLQGITTGGRADAYQPGGFNERDLRDYLVPAERTARLCRMTYLPPFVTFGTHRMDEAAIVARAADWRALVVALRDGRVDPARVAALATLEATDLGA